MSRIVAIDTSTEACSAALLLDGIVTSCGEVAPQAHTRKILPMCHELLTKAGLTLADLDALAFGRGPGSFTGVRIGIGVAQGLALGASLPLIGISNLATLAQGAHRRDGAQRVFCAIDARMNEVYHAAYRWDSIQGQWQTTTTLGLCAPTAVIVPDGFPVVGNAHHVYADLAPQATHYPVLPTAEALLRLAPAFIASGALLDPRYATPYYLRDKVAQTTAERAALTQRIR